MPLSNGLKAAVDVANKNGGVDGHKIEIVVRDDASDPARGLERIREFATRVKASAVVGVNSSVVGAAAAPLVEQMKLPMIGSGLPSDLVNPVKPYVYVSKTDFESQARAKVDFVLQQIEAGEIKPNPRVATLYYSTPAGNLWHEAAEARAKEAQLNVVESQSAQITATDLSGQVARIAAAKPDVVLIFMNAPGVTTVVNQMGRIGVDENTLLIGFNATTSAPFLKELKWKNFVSLGDVRDANAGDSQTFTDMQAGAKSVDTDPNTPSFLDGYMQGLLVLEALKNCGYPCPGEKMKAALDKTSLDGGGLTWGPYRYSPTSHMPVTVVQFERWDEAQGARVAVGDPIQLGS